MGVIKALINFLLNHTKKNYKENNLFIFLLVYTLLFVGLYSGGPYLLLIIQCSILSLSEELYKLSTYISENSDLVLIKNILPFIVSYFAIFLKCLGVFNFSLWLLVTFKAFCKIYFKALWLFFIGDKTFLLILLLLLLIAINNNSRKF